MFLSGGQIDRVRQHERHRDRRAAAAEGQARRGRRRLQHVGDGRRAHAVDDAPPLRPRARRGVRLHHRPRPPHAAGHARRARACPAAARRALVTELGVFDFPDGRAAPARAASPTSRSTRSLAATGFELDVADDLRTVAPPRAEELAVVRSVDRLGVRRSGVRRRASWSGASAGRADRRPAPLHMSARRLAVVGGVAAGMSAAARAKRREPGARRRRLRAQRLLLLHRLRAALPHRRRDPRPPRARHAHAGGVRARGRRRSTCATR